MRPMNLAGNSKSSTYPFVKKTANGCVLGIGPDYHVLRRGNQYVLSTTENGHDIVARSTNNLNLVFELLTSYTDRYFRSQIPTPILDCISLSYVLEVVAGLPGFWDLVFAHPEFIEEFLSETLQPINLRKCISQVKCITEFPIDTRLNQDKVLMLLTTTNSSEPIGLLRFGAQSITFDTQLPNGGIRSAFINFPDYNQFDEPTISSTDYYFVIWTRVVIQLLAVTGIYASVLGISCIEDTSFPPYCWDSEDTKPICVRCLNDIYKVIAGVL